MENLAINIEADLYKKDGSDSYSDVYRNMSRNFTNKVVMRDKVAPKTYCKPLNE